MGKIEKKEDPPKGSPAWMSTFSDLMNLLLCFFVMLFAMSKMDAEKYAERGASFKVNSNPDFSIFNTTEGKKIFDDTMFPSSIQQVQGLEELEKDTGKPNTSNKDKNSDSSDFDAEAYIEAKNKELAEKLYADVTQEVENAELDNTIDVSIDNKYQYVKLTLNGAVLFDSGQSEIKESSLKILSKIGNILKNYKKSLIKIEGHTDNVPMTSGEFKDNMQLSSARAYSVWNYMTKEKSLDPDLLEASGRSEYDPIADNSNAEGMAKNRRVEFKIYTENGLQ